MAADLASVIRLLKNKIRIEDTRLPEEERRNAIRDALEDYSSDRPRIAVAQVSGTGSVFAVPSNFIEGWSTIIKLESPIGQRPPVYMREEHDYDVVNTGSGTQIVFVSTTNPDLPFRLVYKAQHTLEDLDNASATTIPAAHERAFGMLVCHFAALSVASSFATTNTTQIPGDTVNYRTKEQEWRSIAKEFRDDYDKIVKESDQAAVHSYDIGPPKLLGRVPRLWHPRRNY